jgi:hypothetical protein
VELPYGGDMQAAMKARDRDAIKLIMKVVSFFLSLSLSANPLIVH